MDGPHQARSRGWRRLLVLSGFVLACFVVASLSGAVTASSVHSWYPALRKPDFNPPNWVFGPVWTLLYAFIAVAGYRLWRKAGWRTRAMALYAAQLALNFAWSMLFFGLHEIGGALMDILALLAVIVASVAVFRSMDRAASMLFIPYGCWVAFAALLNAAIWRLN